MNELKSIARAAETLRRRAEPFLTATVVRVRGSSYRRPGARMLVTRDRWVTGSVSGGCLEHDVTRKGWWRTRDGGPRLVTYDARAQEDLGWGLGVGCDGVVDVLLEPARIDGLDPIDFIARCYDTQRRGALATVFGGSSRIGGHVAVTADGVAADELDAPVRERLADECRRVLAGGESRVLVRDAGDGPIDALVEAVLPPPRLFVVGAGHDAIPVVTMAHAVGWETAVCDATARFGTRERFAHADEILVATPAAVAARVDACDRAMAVVMAHDYERDRACLAALLETRACYIGMLGPRRRTERMLEELGIARLDPRVRAPVGLAIGAETPQEIALAIVSEAQSVLARASALPLCEQPGAIHAPAV
ncbi:MAG TPA: XdhC family protein [Polyangiaceae bacterium]|jgi:xanthine/CO dehydrogenase XdhC/CoxF family maturation factor|nr:XdhC family protein [Polyangiaceae bacterium]